MNKQISKSFAAIACLAAFCLPLNAAFASTMLYGVEYAYDGQDLGVTPGYIQLNGYYTPQTYVSTSNTDGLGIHSGTQLTWVHSGVQDYVHYVYGKAFFPNESTPGTILDYALDNKTTDNGYFLVAKKDLIDWVNYLGGNATYVDANLKNQNAYSVMETSMGDKWNVADLVKAIDSCGATVDYAGGGAGDNYLVNSDGTTAEPAIKVTPTPDPNSQVSVTQSNYALGSKVPINLTANVYAANTNWHMEAVEVTGPNGFDKFLPVDTGANGTAAAATGTAFPYYGPVNGTLAEVYGGGSGDPSTPTTMNETATLDTAGLQPGTYNVTYTLFDAVGRASDSGSGGAIQTSFTLGNASASGNGATGGGTNPTSTTTMNLSIKYNPFTMPIPIGTANIPVTVSNDGDQDVTTTVTLVRNGYKAVPVLKTMTDSNGTSYTYIDHYNNVPDTQTVSQNVTIPKHGAKQLTFSVFTGQYKIGMDDDPQYSFQIIADVNQSHNPVENTYTDNEVKLYVPTTGQKQTFGPPHLIE